MKPALYAQLKQSLNISPQLRQSIALLQLNRAELDLEIERQLEQNLMLELSEDQNTSAEAAPEQTDPTPVSGDDAGADQHLQADSDGLNADHRSGSESVIHNDRDWIEQQAAPQPADLQSLALAQLQASLDEGRMFRICVAIVSDLDDNAYLQSDLSQIAQRLRPQLAPTAAEMQQALDTVQSLEPSGIAARNLSECLQLQLEALPPLTPGRGLASRIVHDHLMDVARGELNRLAQHLGVSLRRLRAAVDLIRGLNPKPGAMFAASAQAVDPDIVISGQRGAWQIQFRDDKASRLRVAASYAACLRGSGHAVLRDQLRQARCFVRGLQLRQQNMQKVVQAVIRHQARFLEFGEAAMLPLKRSDIADATGLHESTVSRITQNKWVQTPWGVYPFSSFFPRQTTAATGQGSATAIKARIRSIVDTEPRARPMSDSAITAFLLKDGVRVARRTVSKYREAMGIAAVSRRRTCVA
ncbi:MAG: RNA polymerase factor sigma-54 [Panacagrimonas sp.]